jgi:hypothetical protein
MLSLSAGIVGPSCWEGPSPGLLEQRRHGRTRPELIGYVGTGDRLRRSERSASFGIRDRHGSESVIGFVRNPRSATPGICSGQVFGRSSSPWLRRRCHAVPNMRRQDSLATLAARRYAPLPPTIPSAALLLATLFVLLGCDGEERPESAAALDGGGVALDASPGPGASLFRVKGKVRDRQDGGIRGAQVCIAGHDEIPCAVSNSTGEYTMDLPVWDAPSHIAAHVSAVGYLGLVLLVQSPRAIGGRLEAPWFSAIQLDANTAVAKTFREEAGYRFPEPNRGFVRVEVSARVGSATAAALTSGAVELTMEPSGGPPPVYHSGDGGYDPSLKAFVPWTSTGNPVGYALFGEVPPGRFEIAVPGCEPIQLAHGVWPGTKPNAVAGMAVGGALTDVSASCR